DTPAARIVAVRSDISMAIAVEVSHDQMIDVAVQSIAKRYPAAQRASTVLPFTAHDPKNVDFAISVEIPETQNRHAEAGCVHRHERFPAAIGEVPLAAIGEEDIRTLIANEVANSHITDRPGRGEWA